MDTEGLTAQGSAAAYDARVRRALEHAREHADEGPGLAELAAAAAFSPFHFHRIFAALVGETPAEHVRRLRLEKAANRLLYHPDKPVTDIALETGFASPSAFSRDFRARFGSSPSDFRRRRLRALGAAAVREPLGFPAAPDQIPGSAPLRPVPPRPRPAGLPPEDEPPRFETLPAMSLAFASFYGPYGPGVGAAWGALMRWATARGLPVSGAASFGVAWDNPDVTVDGRLRYDACLAVPEGTEGSGKVLVRRVPSYRCLAYPFRGRQSAYSEAYRDLYYRVLPSSGCEPEDHPAFERYLSPPRGLVDPHFEVDILLPVRPLSGP